jgi:hypothetical protein
MPAAHTATVSELTGIIGAKALRPSHCAVFGRSILYLYYGAAFYRPRQGVTRDATWLPVAFLFSPSVLALARCYYPFDTGALAANRFGARWSKRLTPFKSRFRVAGRGTVLTPCKVVFHMYRSNKNYLKGGVQPGGAGEPDPLPLLRNFLRADLTRYGADARQCAIECHFRLPLPLNRALLWIGLPQLWMSAAPAIQKSCKPEKPAFFPYDSHAVFHPGEVCAQLQAEALKFARRRGLI